MISDILRLIRVKHWVKNGFVFVPLVFSKHLFNADYFTETIVAFFAFCFASSIVYVINDIQDVESDRAHTKKKSRPIASGRISFKKAYAVILLMIVLLGAVSLKLPENFHFILTAYIVLNVAYTFILKKIVLLDLISIAAGFMLRVLGGAYAINVQVSTWLILTTLFVSLFLAVMKRRSEIESQGENATREVLESYSIKFIDQISSITAAAVIICYALYSVSERTVQYFHTEYLVYTTIFVIYGIFRYLYLVHNMQKGEDTSEIIFSDLPTLINLVLYGATVIYIVY
ncbi:MAG: decaprenyl-phosphate phosphoribosyltransferase [Chlorobi bacterium]|nr:decaprenyl-phosphate phosphoribosyltransferase [Chlorobiota bacterium]